MRSFLTEAQILNEYLVHTLSLHEKALPQGRFGSSVSNIESLSQKEISVQVSISYQAQPQGLSSIGLNCNFSQQALNGCVAIGTIMTIVLLIRAITPLIKACKA